MRKSSLQSDFAQPLELNRFLCVYEFCFVFYSLKDCKVNKEEYVTDSVKTVDTA